MLEISATIKTGVISTDFVFETFYETLVVNVEEIPVTSKDIISNQDKNTDKIIENQDENTDKIIDNERQMYEDEKAEAESSGNDSVDDLTAAIPSDTDGLLASFNKLISSMLYTGTDVSLTFPTIKTPEILGIIPSYTLTEAKTVNFKEIEEIMPPAILALVRALLTIALILFCFKELYNTISYVLTLRGGASE